MGNEDWISPGGTNKQNKTKTLDRTPRANNQSSCFPGPRKGQKNDELINFPIPFPL